MGVRPRKIPDAKRFPMNLGPLDKIVRQMAKDEERSVVGQVRHLVRIALDKIAPEQDK